MKLDCSKAFVRPMVELPFEVEGELAPQQVNGDMVSFAPVHLQGIYEMTDDRIRLVGELRTAAHAPCAVCLNPVETEMVIHFEEVFRKDANEEEDGEFRYEGKQLDLTHMTLTLVMLHLPMRFKCPGECQADGELMAWNEAETVWAEDAEEPQGTYRPFADLKNLLEGEPKQ